MAPTIGTVNKAKSPHLWDAHSDPIIPSSRGAHSDSCGTGGVWPAFFLPQPSGPAGPWALAWAVTALGLELGARRSPGSGVLPRSRRSSGGPSPALAPQSLPNCVSEPHPNSSRLCQGDWKFLPSSFSGRISTRLMGDGEEKPGCCEAQHSHGSA